MCHRSLPFRALLTISLAALLAACAGDARRDDAFRRSETELAAARERGSVACTTSAGCEQAWRRARLFVLTHSTTPVERETDDAIETHAPHAFGVAYFWAARVTTANGTTVIRLKGLCRGMYQSDGGPGLSYRRCADQLRDAQAEFARTVGGVR